MSLSLQQLAEALQLEFSGDADVEISNVASLESATEQDLCFLLHKRYLADLAASDCAAVILPAEFADQADARAMLIASDPQYSFVRAIGLLGLETAPRPAAGIHPSAQVAASAKLGDSVSVGPLAVIGEEVVIGDRCTVGAGAVIDRSASVGVDCRLHSRVTLGHSVRLGDRCELHAGVVVGSDGFGLVQRDRKWHKVPQLGSVVIGDDVEIGANTTVDRGALDDTVIERGCKLDNLIQVAHNVRIGADTAIAACVGIAGSATIGRCCKISGAAVVLGHLVVADHVTITAMSLVTKDIKKSGVYSSGTPLLENSLWHRNNARYKSLDKLAQTVAQLEKKHE